MLNAHRKVLSMEEHYPGGLGTFIIYGQGSCVLGVPSKYESLREKAVKSKDLYGVASIYKPHRPFKGVVVMVVVEGGWARYEYYVTRGAQRPYPPSPKMKGPMVLRLLGDEKASSYLSEGKRMEKRLEGSHRPRLQFQHESRQPAA